MDLLALGNSSKEIVAALKISTRTVEGHRQRGAAEDGGLLHGASRPSGGPPGQDVGRVELRRR
jgi:regulatory LuxR family protein